MKKFMIFYNGPATPADQMAPDKVQAIMAKWKEWMEKTGNAMVDMGTPLAGGVAVVDDGSAGNATDLSGYSIIQADGIEQAKALVEGHPFLSDKEGKFSIEIHEMLPVPGM